MGIPYQQWREWTKDRPDAAEALAMHPEHPGKSEYDLIRSQCGGLLPTPKIEPPKPKRTKPADGLNKTERAFAEMLDQSLRYEQISGWRREPVKFRLAGRTWYTPDFVVCPAWSPNTPRYIFEVKGFMRDDAAVKLKVAAELYPCFRWFLVFREGRNAWDVREVTSRGIGREPVRIPWIQ